MWTEEEGGREAFEGEEQLTDITTGRDSLKKGERWKNLIRNTEM